MGKISNTRNRQTLTYGELAADAAKLPIPTEDRIELKPRRKWRYMGEAVPSLTVPKIVRGEGHYGIDVTRPNMVYAVIARPPQLFGKTGEVNDANTLKVPGVLKTVRLPDAEPPARFQALGGVAVIATGTWAAMKGRDALEVDWIDGPNANYDSHAYRKAILSAVNAPGDIKRKRGDLDGALAGAENRLTADYYTPLLAHSSMEPPSATAEWSGDRLECWGCLQDAQTTRRTLSQLLDMPADNITVHTTWLGGAFGRKSKPDYVVEAALLAREMDRPVKVVWTREDDLRHDYFHAANAQHFEAALDKDGRCTAWRHRSAFPSILSIFVDGVDKPQDWELAQGSQDVPFDIPNLQVEASTATPHVRIGWLRSVCNTFHAFGVQSFAAELAHAAGRDQKDYLLELIGPPRKFDPGTEGAEYINYNASLKEYPIETGRLRHVIERAADMSRWGRRLPKGHGLGIAAHRSFLSYVATVIEVAVDGDGRLSMPGIWIAADAGTVVNPGHAKAQFEGGVIFGLSNALYGEITAKDGAIVQGNFPDWRLMRLNEAPEKVEVEIVDSDAPPAGAGEPGTPTAAPALTNAIFNAIGLRIRHLPILGPNGDRLAITRTETRN